jgi:hypothetical protein
MAILKIEPVSRKDLRVMAFFYGLSGTGKTLSALKMAAGLEPDPGKRGLLDTEGGNRGQMYADAIEGGYLYASMSPPFTPERYMEAVAEFERAGVNVLVVDSISHVWEGGGGVLEQVEKSQLKNELARWGAPKKALKRLMQKILHSDCHIIMCARAKKTFEEVPNPARPGKTMYVPGPVVPVVEKTLPYDMLFIAHMLGDGKFTVEAPEGKCPGSLRPTFGRSDLISEETGRDLKAWLGEQIQMTAAHRALEDEAFAKALLGTAGLLAWVKGQSEANQAYLRAKWGNLKSVAASADADDEVREGERADEAIAERIAIDGIGQKAMEEAGLDVNDA